MFKVGESYKAECYQCSLTLEEKKDMCAICIAQKIIRGKWKLVIIWLLRDEPKRFSHLLKSIPNIKQGPLSTHLKELESIGVINRKSYNQVPPKVEYSLTQTGIELLEIINQMKVWSTNNLVTFDE